jgi:RimJ/RimL family protein N-acetyltransferase
LQVNDQNVVARRVYERLGFVATGHWETLSHTQEYRRERMRLSVTARISGP